MSRSFRSRLLLASFVLVGLASPCGAINFNLVYLDPATDSRSVANPDDPGGAILRAHMLAAAADWSDVIRDNWTIDVDYFYSDSSQIPSETANADTLIASPDGRRTVSGELKFYFDRDWYYDPTPGNDSEFDMAPILLGDLSPQEQSDGFVQNGVGVPQLEVGYRGQVLDNSQINTTDLLSTARHELGHLLGVSVFHDLPYVPTEVGDGDYDFPPALIGGELAAARFYGLTESPPNPLTFHLESAAPLMSGQSTARGVRRGISEADVLASAAVGAWTQIELSRKTFYGPGSNFNSGANWSGARAPRISDDVSIRHGGAVFQSDDARAGSLVVSGGSTLSVGAHRFETLGLIAIGSNTPGAASAGMVVGVGGEIRARRIEVYQSLLTLIGGEVTTGQGSVINSQGTVQGYGSIRVDTLFDNDGLLRGSGGVLVVDSVLGGALVDLDGSINHGSLQALAGDIDINLGFAKAQGGPHEAFGGTIEVGPGRFVEVADSILLVPGGPRTSAGRLLLSGSSTQPAVFRGTGLEVAGFVTVDRRGEIDAEVSLLAGAGISVASANDSLLLGGDFTQQGGTILGDGAVTFGDRYNATAGQLIVGQITFGGRTGWTEATVVASTIDTGPDGATQRGGLLGFEKYTGDLFQDAGLLQAEESFLSGFYEQSELGVLGVEINGANDYGSLSVTEAARVAGAISVLIGKNYDPAVGERFAVLSAGELLVESMKLIGPDAARFGWGVDGDTLYLEALASPAGDFNGDGLVDAADYTLWADGDPAADADGDGKISTDDYDIWAANYGATGAPSSSAVPEPAAWLLVTLGIVIRPRRSL